MNEFFAALLGGLAVVVTQLGYTWFVTDKPRKDLEERQKKMLLSMLQPENMPLTEDQTNKVQWRAFNTLQNVIGANEVTAKRLLIEIGARGSSKSGKVWALEKHQPLSRSISDEAKDFLEEET